MFRIIDDADKGKCLESFLRSNVDQTETMARSTELTVPG